MKKRTHLLLTKTISSTLGVSRYNNFWLCFGSVFPDLTPMCVLKPHQYDSRNLKILSKCCSLDFTHKDWLFYFKLGVVGHYLADFFTSPHNRKGIVGFCTDHRGYENQLDRFFKVNLCDYKFSSSNLCDLDFFVENYHTDYMTKDSSYKTDFNYICNVVNTLLQYAIKSEDYRGVHNGSTSCQ